VAGQPAARAAGGAARGKILPRSEWLSVEPMKAPDRRCDPGLDALFLSKECGKEPSWLGSPKK
jgi:hypothetical protein